MTRTAFRTAVARLGQFAIRPYAGLRVQAPEEAIIAGWHGRIVLGKNELGFPAQVGTQVRVVGIETF